MVGVPDYLSQGRGHQQQGEQGPRENQHGYSSLKGRRKSSIFVTYSAVILKVVQIEMQSVSFQRSEEFTEGLLPESRKCLTRSLTGFLYSSHLWLKKNTHILSLQMFCERFEQMQHV